jgi:hypothetical protein
MISFQSVSLDSIQVVSGAKAVAETNRLVGNVMDFVNRPVVLLAETPPSLAELLLKEDTNDCR